MSCTRSQLLALLTYLENECRDSGSLSGCLKTIAVLKARVEELAAGEVLESIYR